MGEGGSKIVQNCVTSLMDDSKVDDSSITFARNKMGKKWRNSNDLEKIIKNECLFLEKSFT